MFEKFKKWCINIKNSKNKFFRIYLLVFVVGYIFFFTTPLWNEEEISSAATKLFEIQQYNNREIYISRWDYSEEQKMMEVEICINNKSLDDADTYQYRAIDKKINEMEVEEVAGNKEFKIVRIKGVPKNWKQISLKMVLTGKEYDEKSVLNLFATVESVNKVNSIPDLSIKAYNQQRLENQMLFYAKEIKKGALDILENKDSQVEYANKIQELQDDMKWQTQEEKGNTEKIIEQAENAISQLEKNNDDIQKEIAGYQEKIRKTAEKINGE